MVSIYLFDNVISTFLYVIHIYTSLIAGNADGNSVYGMTNSFCSGVKCRHSTAIIAGSIVGGGLAMILLLIGIIICSRRCKGRPSQTNLTFINATNNRNNKHQFYDITLFKSGIWSGRYLQFGIWHDVQRLTLKFDPQSFKVTGSGSDNVGMFIIDGYYSNRTGRMGIVKTYLIGTGNRLQNFGHHVIIQVTWNSETRQFEGKWYVQTKRYREENKIELKFSKQQQQISPHENV